MKDADHKTCWKVVKYCKMRLQTIIKGIRNADDRMVISKEEIAEELRALSFPETNQEEDIEIEPPGMKPEWLNRRTVKVALSD